jgi:hypothetical protein
MQKANMEITITDETFEYESLDDLQKAAGNTPRGITIEGRDASFRRVALSMFEQYRWHLRSSPDENPYQLARDIDEILQARRTAIKNPTIIGIAMIGSMMMGLAFARSNSPRGMWIGGVAVFLLVLAVSLLAYVNFRGGVNLAYKYEAGFFARNRDKILLLVIGGAVGAVFGAVLTFLVGYLTGKPA